VAGREVLVAGVWLVGGVLSDIGGRGWEEIPRVDGVSAAPSGSVVVVVDGNPLERSCSFCFSDSTFILSK